MENISDRLVAFNARLLPDMLKLKYKAMAVNAFTFFRGTCHIYYQDLNPKMMPPAPLTWICGDMHIENYGSFKGDNRMTYFDMNDFDEGLLAPATWEISRMITSIMVAFDTFKIDKKEALTMSKVFLKVYSDTLKIGKPVSIDPRTSYGIVQTFLEKAANRKMKELLSERTETKKGKPVLSLAHATHFAVDKPLKKQLMAHITKWIKASGKLDHKVLDVAFRLAGTGSIGVKRYVFLLENMSNKKKYLLIDMKQSRPSSVAPYVNIAQPAWENDAERVIAIQQRMQNVNPALITASVFDGSSYVIKELQPMEDKIDFTLIKSRHNDIAQVIEDMALLTASAQLRSSGRQGSAISDDLIAFGEDTQWHNALLTYASAYAKQVNKDYKQFLKDYKAGFFKKS